MKDKCFDAGTIQAFLDGELSNDLLENVARHVALCDDCAALLHEAEEESAFAFEILGEEFDALVPTERIRANVFQAIANYEEPKVSLRQKIIGWVSAFSNPTAASFASLLIVIGIFAVVYSLKTPNNIPSETASNPTPTIETANPNPPITRRVVETVENKLPNPVNKGFEKANYKVETKVQKTKVEVKRPTPHAPRTTTQTQEAVDGEATYLKTIATLETTVNAKKDNVLRASSRVAYERDLAVINDSIKRMKAEIRKNPKNEAAKQILRNSYQNKIELLNSVSERSDLMASLD